MENVDSDGAAVKAKTSVLKVRRGKLFLKGLTLEEELCLENARHATSGLRKPADISVGVVMVLYLSSGYQWD
jgi:hypothetical protein